jgi:PAS domain S-box-containing protein
MIDFYFGGSLKRLTHTAGDLRKRGFKNRIRYLLIFLQAFISSGIVAQTTVDNQRTIRLVMDDAYAPYVFRSDEGELQGILIDQWRAWEKKTGVKTEIYAMDWSEALRSMRAGKFDVIDCIVETANRENYFDFTPGYNTVEASIYFRKDISGISDIASLDGFPIGVKAGDQHVDKLKASGVTTIILFQNYRAIIEAAKKHTINVFLADDPSALYLLNKMGIASEFRVTAPLFRDELRRAVRKGDTATLNLVSRGFAAIDPVVLKQIDEKWLGLAINRNEHYLLYLKYTGYTAAAAILLIAGLAVWNRTLRKRIFQRTEELRQSEDRIRLIIETIPVMIWSLTPDGAVDFINERWLNYSGLSWEQYIKDQLDSIHPEDTPKILEKWLASMATGKPFEDEMRLRRADGEYCWFFVRTSPLCNEQGNVVKWYGVSIDIEDRKRAEDELRLAYQRLSYHVENSPLAVIEWDKDQFITRWSFRAEEIFGWKAEEAIGRNFGDTGFPVVYEQDIEAVNRSAEALIKGIVDRNVSLSRNYTREGKVISCEWYNSALRDERGNIITILSLVHDVTERKKTEETLRQSYEEIRRLTGHLQNIRDEERTHIAREIHDELGGQITVLKMDASWLSQKLNSGETVIKQRIGNSIEILEAMVKSVRRISSELRPSLLDNLGLVAAIEWHLKEFEKRSGIHTIFDKPDEELEIPDEVKNGLFRIFQESLTNVARHSQAKRVKVEVSQKNDQLIMCIADDGKGFEHRKIAKKKTLGILGMTERTLMMGGNYQITSEAGKGTTATVVLPSKNIAMSPST